jgi:hypothetical protein
MTSGEYVWSEEIDRVLALGLDLSDIGVSNWALSRTQALAALNELQTLNVAVLGGDVYQIGQGRAVSLGEGWQHPTGT